LGGITLLQRQSRSHAPNACAMNDSMRIAVDRVVRLHYREIFEALSR
jgi:hypothetical protein